MKTFTIIMVLLSSSAACADVWQRWDGKWMPSEHDPRLQEVTRSTDGSIRCRGQVRRHRTRVMAILAKKRTYRLAYRYFCLPGQKKTRLDAERAPAME